MKQESTVVEVFFIQRDALHTLRFYKRIFLKNFKSIDSFVFGLELRCIRNEIDICDIK